MARPLARPVLAIIDWNPGLTTALRAHWSGLAIQRCTAHKLRNLEANAPARLREEIAEDYRRMIYSDTVAGVGQARGRFTKKGGCDVLVPTDSLGSGACAATVTSGRSSQGTKG